MEGVCKACSSSERFVPAVSEAAVTRDAHERKAQQFPLKRYWPVFPIALSEILILQSDLREKLPLASFESVLSTLLAGCQSCETA